MVKLEPSQLSCDCLFGGDFTTAGGTRNIQENNGNEQIGAGDEAGQQLDARSVSSGTWKRIGLQDGFYRGSTLFGKGDLALGKERCR